MPSLHLRLPVPALLAALLCAALGAGLAPSAALAESCPNEQLRTGLSTFLPDCRAFERVSPVGLEPQFEYVGAGNLPGEPEALGPNDGTAQGVQASTGDNGLAFAALQAPSASSSPGEDVISAREEGGWVTRDIVPPQSTSHSALCANAYPASYTPDLSRWVLGDGFGQSGSGDKLGTANCGRDEPSLVAGEPEGFQNLFLTQSEPGPYKLVDSFSGAPSGESAKDSWFQAASEDLTHVVFDEAARLTPEAPAVVIGDAERPNNGVLDLYESTGGVVRLVTFLPDGTPTAGVLANGYEPEAGNMGTAAFTHAVSRDGSRVFFQARGNLYLRENASEPQSPLAEGACRVATDACTAQVDLTQAGATGASGGGKFMWASADGSKVFFTDCSRLTADATAVDSEGCEHTIEPKPSVHETVITGNDLYEYNLDKPAGERLTDLSVDPHPATDSSCPHEGGPSSPCGANVQGVSGTSEDGSYVYFVADGVLSAGANSHGDTAAAGEPNLYVVHDGDAPRFVAALDEPFDWLPPHATRVTPDGRFIAFNSKRRLTGYDNTDSVTSFADSEIFLYDAASEQLSCVSCNPGGTPPMGGTRLELPVYYWFGGALPVTQPGNLQRNLSNTGQVFFSTQNALLRQASNGLSNVYEYENGELHLLSSGTGGSSYFYEATPDGSNVFMIAQQELPSGDPSPEFSVVDARVDGGFPASASTSPCAEVEVCAGSSPAPPASTPPASSSLTGAGNLAPPPAAAPPVKHPPPLTRAQKLARALRACHAKHNRHKRTLCERQARKRFSKRSRSH